jgi:hypothetical protein
MSEFRTIVRTDPGSRRIDLKNTILTAGSCFADAMGKRFNHYKFPALANPFGATYNPISIHKSLEPPAEDYNTHGAFVQNQGLVFHYDFHSQWSSHTEAELNRKLAEMSRQVQSVIQKASVIILTYGTSWVYTRKENGEIVANCHKVPADRFNKSLLREQEIIQSFQALYQQIKKINPDCFFILTVSPVRHLKDTLELNSVSKSVLRTSCHSIVTNFQDVDYFPAYEIMMDDLRDYRFYKSDMIHPTDDAENYIWKKFGDKYFNDNALAFMNEWDEIASALRHKPFHPQSESHQKFLRNTLQKLKQLRSTVNVETEIDSVESQLL